MLNDDGSTEPEISSWEAAEDGFVIRFSSERNAFPSPIQRVPLSELYYYARKQRNCCIAIELGRITIILNYTPQVHNIIATENDHH